MNTQDKPRTVYEKQGHIDYGFTDFKGNKWTEAQVKAYNNLTDDINKSAGIEIVSDSLTDIERNFFLDQRHKLFVSITSQPADVTGKLRVVKINDTYMR